LNESAQDTRTKLLETARHEVGASLIGYHIAPDGALCLLTTRSGYHRAAEVVRDAGIDRLDFLSCVDWNDHFTLVLQGYSFTSGLVVRLRTQLAREGHEVPTVTDLWFLADWEERETFDQFGIVFSGHPDLRRLLNIDSWEGHPLRKDYVDRVDITRPQYF
jgi:NADH-quinone oxidoreductase subunit C